MTNQKDKLFSPGDANAAYMQYLNSQRQTQDGQPGVVSGVKPFRYDFNGDALYQQAAQRYQQLGRQAMMDTIGSASTLTGGYGNSYAQNAGQQAYQSYLQGLNDNLPQFQQMAMNQYQLDYSQYQDNQKLAQAQVDYLLSIGVQPDKELLAMAGYSDQYAKQVMERANAGGGGGTAPVQNTLADQVNEAINKGMDVQKASTVLSVALKNGDITPKEYSDAYKGSVGKIEESIVRVPGGGVVNGVLKYKK